RAITENTTWPGFNISTPRCLGTILQCGGKMLETVTRLTWAMPASRSASSKLVSCSRWRPMPLVRNIALGTSSIDSPAGLAPAALRIGSAELNAATYRRIEGGCQPFIRAAAPWLGDVKEKKREGRLASPFSKYRSLQGPQPKVRSYFLPFFLAFFLALPLAFAFLLAAILILSFLGE